MSDNLERMQRLHLAGTLASGIAHDLNNQLTLVLGNLEMAMDRLPAGYQAYGSLELAMTAVGRCADMSRRLLALGRENRTKMTQMDMAASVIEAQRMLECVKPANTRMSVDTEAGLIIVGDATQIQQVLINLGTNAFRAMPKGGDLKIRAYYQDGEVCVTFTDTGCGIPQSMRQQIFEPFFTTHGETGGSGLGLATVRSIVKAHAGVIALDSAPGKGSTFILMFPLLAQPSL
jgi:signal transduction histidine kinase